MTQRVKEQLITEAGILEEQLANGPLSVKDLMEQRMLLGEGGVDDGLYRSAINTGIDAGSLQFTEDRRIELKPESQV